MVFSAEPSFSCNFHGVSNVMAAISFDRVAVIDDRSDAAESTSVELEDAGFTPIVLKDGFKEVGELVAAVKEVAEAAVCDHRLGFTGYAPFLGAEAVAALVEARVPSVLVTTFPMDFEVSIRAWRDRIPAVLNRSELRDPDAVRYAFQICSDELAGQPSTTRVLRRTILTLDKVTDDEGQRVADAVIPAWDPITAVRFPVSLMGDVSAAAKAGESFFAYVNTGARRSEDLVLKHFSLAPPPDPDDGLG